MAQNLFKLLKLSNVAPPECQLDSGEVEWAGEVPIEGGTKNTDIYKGRYLQSEYVRIKVIRSVNMKNERTVEVCRHAGILPNLRLKVPSEDKTRGQVVGRYICNG
jgi:hypothetical protein